MEDANDVGAPLHLLIQTLDRVQQRVLYDLDQCLIAKVLRTAPSRLYDLTSRRYFTVACSRLPRWGYSRVLIQPNGRDA